MAVKRDEQGRLVVDGKVVPKYTEQLYLRREGNKDFPSKAEADTVIEDGVGAVDMSWAGGEVDHMCTMEDKDLPKHEECKVPETLRKVKTDASTGYSLVGVNYDEGEKVEEEPIEEQK